MKCARAKSRPPAHIESLEARCLLSNTVAFAAPVAYPNPPYPSTVHPTAVAAADVTGDGIIDMIVALDTTHSIDIYPGIGNGTFAAPQSHPVGAGVPVSIAVADVNGDAVPDLIVAEAQGAVSILLGTGAGGFSAPTEYPVGASATSVAVGDLNGDNVPDIVTANDGGVSVIFNNGNGTFGPAQNFSTDGTPASVTIADVTGDGPADIVTANATSTTVSILAGDGAGHFAPHQDIAIGENANPIAATVADVNGDGFPDIITVDNHANVSVLLADGHGGFMPPMLFGTIGNGYAITAADINGDGNPDLVIAESGKNAIGVMLGNGDGTFQAPTLIDVAAPPGAVAVGDLNSDGQTDVITANPSSNNLSVLLNQTIPNTNTTQTVVTAGTNPATFGIPVELTATVAATGTITGVPTGSVSFFSNRSPLGDGTIDSNGAASILVSTLALGANQITASYPGDGTFAASTSPAYMEIVNTGALGTMPTQTTVSSNTNPAPEGTAVQLTATVTATGGMPTGNVNFYSDVTSLGAAPLAPDGTATLAVSNLPAGIDNIVASYDGDNTFAGSTSTSLVQTVIPAAGGGSPGALVPQIISLNLGSTFVPGDSASLRLALINGGAARLRGVVAAQLFFSADTSFSADDVPVPARSLSRIAIALPSGKAKTLNAKFTIPATLAPGSYYLLAQLIPVSGISTADSSTAAVSSAQPNTAALAFGTVGSRAGRKLVRALPTGGAITFALSGPGTGVVSQDPTGNLSIQLTGTTLATRVNITTRAAGATITNLSADSSVGTINAPKVTLDGVLNVAASLRNLTLGAVSNADILIGASLGPNATPGGGDDVVVAASLGSLKILGSVNTSLIASGLDPGPDGVYLTSDDTLIAGASIKSITVGGLSDDSHIVAATLALKARIGRTRVLTSQDARFRLPG